MAVLRRHLGPEPLQVLELASGTGEVTRVLRALGHRVTGLDFSEAMIARARAKHRGDGAARFVLADAENTMEPDGAYDAVVCRHLVWTLTDPQAALHDWFRTLRPDGRLVVFDGNFVTPSWSGRVAKRALAWLEARGAAPHRAPADAGARRHPRPPALSRRPRFRNAPSPRRGRRVPRCGGRELPPDPAGAAPDRLASRLAAHLAPPPLHPGGSQGTRPAGGSATLQARLSLTAGG
jgi:SAM-dependent methyltransferase